MQCIQVVTGAIFQDSGYSITITDKADNEYIWGNNFDGKCLVQCVSDSFPSIVERPERLLCGNAAHNKRRKDTD